MMKIYRTPPIKNPGYANAHSVHRHLEDRQEEVVAAVGVPDATGLQFVFFRGNVNNQKYMNNKNQF